MEEKMQEIIKSIDRMVQNGVLFMTEDEFHHSEVVGDALKEDMNLSYGDSPLSLYGTIVRAKHLLSIYSLPSIEKLHKIPFSHSEENSSPILQFTTYIHSDGQGGFITEKIQVPIYFDSLSPYYLAHEYHHALKDTNPKEYQYMLRYADVIPQFFELISGVDDETKKRLVHNRLAMLHSLNPSVNHHQDREQTNSLFNIIDSKNCQYLNSFYYSVLLYGLYQNHPKKVLEEVRKVLMGEMTTFQLLEEFSLLDSSHDQEVQRGIQYLKKYSS